MYIGTLLDTIREKTGNANFSRNSTTGVITEGISDDAILSFINDALAYIQSRVIAVYPSEFVVENIQSTVNRQEEYSIDDNIFLNNKYISVEYSRDANPENFAPLPPASFVQRDTRYGEVYQYIRRNGKLLLNKIPNNSNGSLRVNYYRALDKLDIRRGQITSKTTTTIVLDDDDWLDNFALSDAQYICLVDKHGTVLEYNIAITSYDTTTRTITIPTQTLSVSAGDYVVIGKYTSTHLDPTKPQRLLDYCKLYAQARVYNTDSSMDEINERAEVKDVLLDIIDGFSELSEDVMDVTVIDEYLQ